MDCIVCVKRVPATTIRVKVGADGRTLDPTGVDYILNPYDEYAVEEALQRREAAGEGCVSVISFGPAEAQKELRTTLAMGADQALLLQNPSAAEVDGATTARVLADALRGRDFDLLLFGKQAVDRDQHGVGPMVATLLGVPCVSEVISFTIADGRVSCVREVEGGRETVEAPLPCALTCQKGLNEPRYASLKGIMAAKRKPLEVVETEIAESAVELLAMELPPERPAGRIVGEGAAAAAELVDALKNEAKVL